MKKILSSLLLVVFSFLILAKVSFAQTPANYTAPNLNYDVPQTQSTWIQSIMLNSMSALACQLAGYDPLNQQGGKCLGYDTKTGKLGYVETGGGLIGFGSKMIGQLFIIPLNSGDYIKYMVGNFGVAKSSYAQSADLGFDSLSPLADLWAVFRNIVYAFFIVIFIVIGVAIMFRVKIDPRTVMTVQNQLPKIIIGLILVTFSLAIAGILIDLMYVASYLAVGIFAQANPEAFSTAATTIIGSTNPFDGANSALGSFGLGNVTSGAAGSVGGHLGNLFDNPIGRTVMGLLGGVVGMIIGGTIGNLSALGFNAAGLGALIGSAAGAVIGAVGAPQIAGTLISMIAFLVIAVAIIASLFRLWFQLIIAFVSILIDIVFAPFWIAAGLIPGSKINFSSWLRNLTANLAAFPAVIIIFMLANIFIYEFGQEGSSEFFTPPFIGDPANASQIGSIIALGLILLAPNVVKLMKQIFGAPQAGFGPVFEGISTGFGIVATPTRRLTGALFGKNPYTNAPRAGSRIFGNMLRNRVGGTFGAWGQLLTGGGTQGQGQLMPRAVRRLNPRLGRAARGMRNPQQPVQGPVPPGANRARFWRTGNTPPNTQGGNNQGGNTGGNQGGNNPPPGP